MKKLGLLLMVLVLASCANITDSESDNGGGNGFTAQQLVTVNYYWQTMSANDFTSNDIYKGQVTAFESRVDVYRGLVTKANERVYARIGEIPSKVDIDVNVYFYESTFGPTYAMIFEHCIVETSKGIAVLCTVLNWRADSFLYNDIPPEQEFWQYTGSYNEAVLVRNLYSTKWQGTYITSHCWLNGVRQY